MNLAASETLETDAEMKYLCTLVGSEALHQFDLLSADTEITGTRNVEYIIKDLALYYPHVNSLPKGRRSMRRGMKKTRSLTVRRYVARLIDLNEYLASWTGETLYDKIGVTELNKLLSNSTPNIWSKQAYLQGFDCESILFKKAFNMFERM